MVDYIADYLQNIRERRVLPDVKPGYMATMLPESAPLEGEPWQAIIDDVELVIMPGITHWQSPHMHAYFPALNSFPSMLGDMLADAINCLGFTWVSLVKSGRDLQLVSIKFHLVVNLYPFSRHHPPLAPSWNQSS